jgi:hypothetical protein
MMLLAEPAGRLLERTGNRASRGMTVHDRTRLIGQLHSVSHFVKKAASTFVEAAFHFWSLSFVVSDPLPGLNSRSAS